MEDEQKQYKLLGPDGKVYLSDKKGLYGGCRSTKIYGRMDCSAALRALNSPGREVYIRNRVFFQDEATALAAGFRPCGRCLRDKYKEYQANPQEYKAKFDLC